jgi:hypothetical protein
MLKVDIYHVDAEGNEYNLEITDQKTCEKITELLESINTDRKLAKRYLIYFILMCVATLLSCYFYIVKSDMLLSVVIGLGTFNIYNLAMNCAGRQARAITERELSELLDTYIKKAKQKPVNTNE